MIDAALQLSRPGFTLDVDLQLPDRGVTALFGPSGCGKTSLLRALAGLERARGRVALADTVWQDDARRVFVPTHQRPLGYVIQEAALFPHLSVEGNLDYGRRRSADRDRVDLDQVVALLGIGTLMKRQPADLSGGERQRVAIARALATGPRLLLMDEPLAALDAARKADVLPYLERLHRELALPVIYVTHAIDEVARLADHLVMMAGGRVQAQGPVAELMARADLPLSRPDDAGVVVQGRVQLHDRAYGLMQVQFDGGSLWVGETEAEIGQWVRARVLARDVSVTRQPPLETSVLNVLPVQLRAIWADRHTAVLSLAAGAQGVPLLARVTRRSCDALALQPGDALYAQIKGVALM
jgi:molybdate transport system ATP-binding protein